MFSSLVFNTYCCRLRKLHLPTSFQIGTSKIPVLQVWRVSCLQILSTGIREICQLAQSTDVYRLLPGIAVWYKNTTSVELNKNERHLTTWEMSQNFANSKLGFMVDCHYCHHKCRIIITGTFPPARRLLRIGNYRIAIVYKYNRITTEKRVYQKTITRRKTHYTFHFFVLFRNSAFVSVVEAV